MYIYVTDSLWCTQETDTILCINCTSIKIERRKEGTEEERKKHLIIDWLGVMLQFSDKCNFRTPMDSLGLLSLGFCTTLISLGESCKWTKVYYLVVFSTELFYSIQV